jgi:hypothetical protein
MGEETEQMAKKKRVKKKVKKRTSKRVTKKRKKKTVTRAPRFKLVWINKKRSLPEVGEKVLTLMLNNDVILNTLQVRQAVTACGETETFYKWDQRSDSVTHWLRLPPLPKSPHGARATIKFGE